MPELECIGGKMTYVLTFLAGGFIGGMVGIFTMCAMIAAGEADDREERWFYGRSDKSKKGD
jgi:hypothetical protein